MYMFHLLLISTCLICSAVSADTPVANEDFKLLASDAASGERFGRRVAIDGNNGTVEVNDIILLIAYWGCTFCDAADVNGDCIVDVNDLVAIIAAWGPCE